RTYGAPLQKLSSIATVMHFDEVSLQEWWQKEREKELLGAEVKKSGKGRSNSRYIATIFSYMAPSVRMKVGSMLLTIVSIQTLTCSARPLLLESVSSNRELLQSQACPAPMTQCYTTPYQPQYYCCDSSQNLDCSGGADFQCRKFLEGDALVPASLIPDLGLGPKTPEPTSAPAVTPAPTTAAKSSSASDTIAQTTAPTNPPQNPAPTNPPQNPSPTNPPQNPSPTNPPQNPSPTNPPQTPAPTNPPQIVTAVSAPGGWTTGIATFFGGPGAFTGGNCGYGPIVPANDYVVALPNHLYYSNAGCGSCYEVKCVAPSTLPFIIGGVEGGNACKTDKSIIVYASDRCPECDDYRGDCTLKGFCPAAGGYNSDPSHGTHIDIGQPAWNLIGKVNAGIITVAFRQVTCPPFGQLGLQN
ncbi:hypothetical protein KFL_003860010, partial [Klebsormidium nitens]